MSYRRAKKRLKEEKKEEEEEETKEKTKHHKHNISAGFHPGIDKEEEEEETKEKTKHHKHNISAGFHPGIDKEEEEEETKEKTRRLQNIYACTSPPMYLWCWNKQAYAGHMLALWIVWIINTYHHTEPEASGCRGF